MATEVEITDVHDFWNAHPCQSGLSEEENRRTYFDEIEAARYKHEPHIPGVSGFDKYAGQSLLEIGLGVGTDGLQFARGGAKYTGLDLTPASVEVCRERFRIYGVAGEFEVGNAEAMPFADAAFDHVHSFGVIHHSPNTEQIVAEIHRVLKPGGTVCVMVYNRASINYYLEIMFVRKLLRCLLYPAFMPKLISKLSGFPLKKLEGHRKLLLEGGMTKEKWISVNTDGPTCPLAKVYNAREARELFKAFNEIAMRSAFFDKRHWPGLNKLMPRALVDWLGRHWGWHRMIYAKK